MSEWDGAEKMDRGQEGGGYALLLEFDTPGSEFVRGVEVGRLWEMAKSDEAVEQTIHATNAEMAMRIAEATHRRFTAVPLDAEGHWMELWMGEPEDR